MIRHYGRLTKQWKRESVYWGKCVKNVKVIFIPYYFRGCDDHVIDQRFWGSTGTRTDYFNLARFAESPYKLVAVPCNSCSLLYSEGVRNESNLQVITLILGGSSFNATSFSIDLWVRRDRGHLPKLHVSFSQALVDD